MPGPVIRKFATTKRFDRDAKKLAPDAQDKLQQTLADLKREPVPNGCRVKRVKGTRKVWEARLDRSMRLTFHTDGDTAVLRRVGPHDIVEDP